MDEGKVGTEKKNVKDETSEGGGSDSKPDPHKEIPLAE